MTLGLFTLLSRFSPCWSVDRFLFLVFLLASICITTRPTRNPNTMQPTAQKRTITVLGPRHLNLRLEFCESNKTASNTYPGSPRSPRHQSRSSSFASSPPILDALHRGKCCRKIRYTPLLSCHENSPRRGFILSSSNIPLTLLALFQVRSRTGF